MTLRDIGPMPMAAMICLVAAMLAGCVQMDVAVGMDDCFVSLSEEWWHFTLVNEPYPDTYFDFPVIRRHE